MSGSDLRRQTLSSLRWSAIAKFGGQLASWAITLVVIRLLFPADYGLLAMANVVIGLLAMVAEMGFGAALVQSPEWNRRRASQLFGAAVVVNSVLCAALAGGAPLLGRFLDEPRVVPVVQVLALQFIVGAFALVPDSFLRRAMRFKSLSIIEICSGVLGNVLTLTLAVGGAGVWALVLGSLAGAISRAVMLQLVAKEIVAPSFNLSGAKSHLAFGASLTTTRILAYIFSQSDVLIVAKVLGKEAVGLYSVAMHLATLPVQRAASVVNDVAFTAFAKIQHDHAAVRANVLVAIRLIALIGIPTLWGIACTAPEMVRLVMGEQWLDSILPLQIIAIAVPLRMIGTIVSTTTMSVGRVDITLLTTLAGALVAPPLFFFAAGYGIVAVSGVWAAITPLMLVLNLYRATPNLGLAPSDVFREMLRPATAALFMVGGVMLLRNFLLDMPLILRLLLEVVAGIALYAVATTLVNRRAAREALHLLMPGKTRPA
jgi:teichuronic acid exporter